MTPTLADETVTSTSETVWPADTEIMPRGPYYDALERFLENLFRSRAQRAPQSFDAQRASVVHFDVSPENIMFPGDAEQVSATVVDIGEVSAGVQASIQGLELAIAEIKGALPWRFTESQLGRVLGRLEEFGRLERGWDSYDAEPISLIAMGAARALLFRVADLLGGWAVPFGVAPLPSGGVQLQWRGHQAVIEVEVGPQGDYGYLLIRGEGASRSFEEKDQASLSQVLTRIVQEIMA